jgi:TPR repeat protein
LVLLASLLLAVLAVALVVYKFKYAVPSAPGPSLPTPADEQAKVKPGVPVVTRFRAVPSSIDSGTAAMLSWNVTGADEVTIDQGVGKVPASGALPVRPTASTSYILAAAGPGGRAQAKVTLAVKTKTPSPEDRARAFYELALDKKREGKTPDSIPLLRQAAGLGNADAMEELGEMYRSGEGVALDYAEALEWFHRAADRDNSSAMVSLGVMYAAAEGVAASDGVASRWFQKAADHGNASGMFNLAEEYESGMGVPKNLDKAMELYEKAALLGNSEALRRLNPPPRRQ